VSDFTRREIVAAIAAMSVGAALKPTQAQAAEAVRRSVVRRASGSFAPKIYTEHEWATVRVLVDDLFPADAQSGSATEAGVPEFMDTMLDLEPGMRTAHRGGLAWLDHECRERFKKDFSECEVAERHTMLDDVAWPDRAPEEYSHGVRWFNSFRDFAATGYWTSEFGFKEIGYLGNVPWMSWVGCPA
jgi:gluconate 2-dehydrogenase gamma chain